MSWLLHCLYFWGSNCLNFDTERITDFLDECDKAFCKCRAINASDAFISMSDLYRFSVVPVLSILYDNVAGSYSNDI